MSDTLATIRTLLTDRAAGSSNDPIFDPSVLDRIINAANLRLGRVHDWPWLQVLGTISWTANDTDGYDLSAVTSWRHTKHLGYEDQKLQYATPQAFVAKSNRTGATPDSYTIMGSTLYLAPNPTQAVTLRSPLRGRREPASLGTATRPLPAAYTELLVLLALQPSPCACTTQSC